MRESARIKARDRIGLGEFVNKVNNLRGPTRPDERIQMHHWRFGFIIVFGIAVLAAGCGSSGRGTAAKEDELGATIRAGGSRLVWDFAHEPLPDIPLPNNAVTREDATSPTGRRVTVLANAVTRYERRVRAVFNRLDGFGAYAPITVRFDAPLDLAAILARHGDNDDFRDDAVFLLNVDPACERFGEEIALDFGRGRFPITLMSRSSRVPDPQAPFGYRLDEGGNRLFPFDPYGESLTLLFPDFTEDTNRNGVLDPGEDHNENGVLDIANFADPHACDAVEPSTPAHARCIADNLLNWYERATHTLILRPVWPLEERCTHAVVLTNRLRGTDGKPVESPFDVVYPEDQRDDLEPLVPLLRRYGLAARDVTFAWSFVVGTMTKDFEQLRAGLYGHGPLARLAGEFPVSGFDVWTRNEWRDIGGDGTLPEGGDARVVDGGCVATTFAALAGQFDGAQQICGGYADFASIGAVFAGTFTAPNLLIDRDSDATPMYPADEDEIWDLDAETGRAVYGSTDVTFFCVLPRDEARPAEVSCTPGNPEGRPWCKPYPVVFYTHGYGSFKGEVALHAGRHTQMGMAACGIDSFGHGRSTVFREGCPGASDIQLGKLRLRRYGNPELVNMIFYGRDRDLNNDGCPDSGADQWTANLFHTRDVVRQSVLEQMQFIRILHAVDGIQRDARGNILGDVDGDGDPDIGGANAVTAAWGISLGGQLLGVLAGAEPTLDAVSPNAVGGGLTDISIRLGQGGLAEAVMLPVQGPILVACLPADANQNARTSGENGSGCLPQMGQQPEAARGPQRAGELLLAWYAHDNARLAVRAFARVPGVAPGDRVVVENVSKQLDREARLNSRGWARVHLPADALTPIKKRKVLGLQDGDRESVPASDTTALGDRVRVRVVDGATGTEKAVVDNWHWDVTFQGAVYPTGQPLVALQEGMGYPRNTPEFRRFYGIAQHAIAPADPAVWATRYIENPIEAPYDPAWWPGRRHVLVMPTIGDAQVPAATGVALGRSAGLLGSWRRDPERYAAEHGWRELFTPDPRYGVSIDQWLVDTYVVEGDWRLQRWDGYTANPSVLFDPDDVSDGTASFSCLHASDWSAAIREFGCPPEIDDTDTVFGVPNAGPGRALRADRRRPDGSFDAFRIPLLRPAGQHGIYNPQPFRAFDADAYMVNFTARFLASRGGNVAHEAGCDCAYAERPRFFFRGQPAWPGVESVGACPESDTRFGKVCSPVCAEGWGLPVIPPVSCDP